MNMADENSEGRALLSGSIAILLWSSVATAFKLALTNLSPVQLLAGATCTSTLVFAAALQRKGLLGRALRRDRVGWTKALILSSLNPLGYYSVLFGAYHRLPAHVALALNYTWPAALTLLALPTSVVRPNRYDWSGLALAYAGVLCVASGPQAKEKPIDLLGVALALASALLWALYWRRFTSERRLRQREVEMFRGFLLASPIALACAIGLDGWPVELSLRALGATLYVGLFEMGLAFLLWQAALLATKKVSRLSILAFLSPILSLVWIRLVLKETISSWSYFGLSLVILAALLQGRGARATKNEPTVVDEIA